MKKFKLLPTVLMLVLCVGVLAVGVFAITPNKNTISGAITINATNPGFGIKVYKSEVNAEGVQVGNENKVGSDYTIRSGISIGLGDLVFNTSGVNTASEVNKIRIRFEVTNVAPTPLGVYFSKDATPAPAEQTAPISLSGGKVVGTFDNYIGIKANGTYSTCLTFSLEELTDGDVSINLETAGISLNIEDYNSNFFQFKDDAYYRSKGYEIIGEGEEYISRPILCEYEKVKIADGVKGFDSYSYGYIDCERVSEIVIPGGFELGEGNNTFINTYSVEKVVLQSGVTSQNSMPFVGTWNEDEVTIYVEDASFDDADIAFCNDSPDGSVWYYNVVYNYRGD